MTWHSATVPIEGLGSLLAAIRSLGGTVTNSRPQPDGVCLVWTTVPAADQRNSTRGLWLNDVAGGTQTSQRPAATPPRR